MGAAFLGIDVVDEAVDVLLIAVIVLKGYLHHDIILGAVEVNRLRVEDLLLLVQVLHKGADAAIKMEALILAGAFIHEMDGNLLVQEGQLTETVLQCIIAVLGNGENLLVRQEMHLSACFLSLPDHLHR